MRLAKTFFVQNWATEEGEFKRQEKFWELHSRILDLLTVSETVKVPITYTEFHNMLYPEFLGTQKTLSENYQKLMEEANKVPQNSKKQK